MEKGQQWKWDKEHLTDPSAIAKNALPGVKNYVRDEMLGFDDFGNAAKHAKSGNVFGAIKSGLAGAAELALTVGTAGIGTGAKAVAKPVVKKAVTGATGSAAAQGVKKAEAEAAKGPKFFDDPFTPRVREATTSGYPRTGGTSSGPARGGSNGKSGGLPDASTSGLAGTKTKTKTQTPWAPEYSPVKAEPLPKLLPKPKTSVKPSVKPSLKPVVKPSVKPEPKVEPKTKTETKNETKTKEDSKIKEDTKKTNAKKNNAKKIIPIIPALIPKGDGPWTPSAIV